VSVDLVTPHLELLDAAIDDPSVLGAHARLRGR
jgi:hypothetical protein